MNFKEEQGLRIARIEEIIKKYLPREEGFHRTLPEAVNYSVLAGGKRLRPMLMEESFRLFNGTGAVIEPFMAALEMIHNYSLVHDDLPAMDNDEYRRGQKTTWAVFGEGMAVLAGDGLLNLAYETAAGAFSFAADFDQMSRIAKALRILGAKAGINGMIAGQTADIEAESGKNPLTQELLLFIHEKKTAALIEAAFMIGAVLAGASDEETARMETAARKIGVAFQIQDDILDVVSTQEILGKPVGSDEKNNKLTYVSLKGIEPSRQEVERLSGEAIGILNSFANRNEFLTELVKSLIHREK